VSSVRQRARPATFPPLGLAVPVGALSTVMLI
jgi:hypothetical protein